MDIAKNPSDQRISELCSKSKSNAAKWIKDVETGDMYFCPEDQGFHAEMAAAVNVVSYTKGIATL